VPVALGQAGAGQPQITGPDVAQARALQFAVADRHPPERALEKAGVRGARTLELGLLEKHRVEIGPVEVAVTGSERGRVWHIG